MKQKIKLAVKVSALGLLSALAIILPAVGGEEFYLDVGIVQRFGEKAEDEIVLESPDNAPLRVEFEEDGNAIALLTNRLTLEIEERALEKPQLRERLVLSDHATFETAESSAKNWEERGLLVEVTQPGRWQVWAKTDIYRTPLLRRFLLASLEEEGYEIPYLQTEFLEEVPIVTFEINGERYTVENLSIQHEGERIYVDASDEPRRLYPGSLQLQPNSYGNYTLVNTVEVEDYLRGVVPHEIGHQAPFEAVKAQAIIARTYALRNLHRFEADDYELCATVHCQVYWGWSETNDRSDRAIQDTARQILSYDNQLVDALYSSTTGGVTAYFDDIWDGSQRPYLKSVVDSTEQIWDLEERPLDAEENFRKFIEQENNFNETGSHAFRWQRESNFEELTEDLQTYLERTNHPDAEAVTEIKEMTVTARSRSGRILEMEVETNQGTITLEKTEVRSAFDPPRSTLFYLQPVENNEGELTGYEFIGGGFGHGVGLSQIGAHHLARQGWAASEILSFYYPETEIIPLEEVIEEE